MLDFTKLITEATQALENAKNGRLTYMNKWILINLMLANTRFVRVLLQLKIVLTNGSEHALRAHQHKAVQNFMDEKKGESLSLVLNDDLQSFYYMDTSNQLLTIIGGANLINVAFMRRQRELVFDYLVNEVYEKGTTPPTWSREVYVEEFDKWSARAFLIHGAEDNMDDVRKLATEREPVNMTAQRHYKQNKLYTKFGYKTGYYDRYFDQKNTLAPNIAVLSQCPVYLRTKKKYVLVFIYHAIGLAFDSPVQSDYKYFNTYFPTTKDKWVQNVYVQIINKIFATAKRFGFKTIMMAGVGAGAFAIKYHKIEKGTKQQKEKASRKYFITNVFTPAYQKVRAKYTEIEVAWYGDDLSGLDEQHGRGNFPEPAISSLQNSLERVMFVNAWDMLSFPGNGNTSDDSLDGWVGRSSACAMFGTGLTNPNLLKQTVAISELN